MRKTQIHKTYSKCNVAMASSRVPINTRYKVRCPSVNDSSVYDSMAPALSLPKAVTDVPLLRAVNEIRMSPTCGVLLAPSRLYKKRPLLTKP